MSFLTLDGIFYTKQYTNAKFYGARKHNPEKRSLNIHIPIIITLIIHFVIIHKTVLGTCLMRTERYMQFV